MLGYFDGEAAGRHRPRISKTSARRVSSGTARTHSSAAQLDPGPTFTFAHVVAPHPPFVFAADGSYRPERARAAFADGNGWRSLARPYHEDYGEGYVAQVAWLDAELPRVLAEVARLDPHSVVATPPTLEELFLRHYGDELAGLKAGPR